MNRLPIALLRGRHFDHSIIILRVRWYITYKLSYRDLVEMMSERGVVLAHTTILRWVQCFVPKFEKRWCSFSRPVSTSWRVDEIYIKVKGRWTYLYRAVDKQGRTVDFLLSLRHDIAVAKQLFTQAIEQHGVPEKITVDGYPATQTAISELKGSRVLPSGTRVWTSKYLNNIIAQDHRRVKQRICPMLGLKKFENAVIMISGIELAQKIKKEQFDIAGLGRVGARMPQIWEAILAA